MIKLLGLIIIYLVCFNISYAGDKGQNNQTSLPDSSVKILDKVIKNNLKKNKKTNVKSFTLDLSILPPSNVEQENKADNKSPDIKEEKIDITISKFKKIPEIDKDLSDALTAYELGQIEVAVYLYKKVLSKKSNNYNALFGLASIYQSNKQLEEARSIYTKLLNLYPTDEAALNNFIKLSGEEAPDETIEELKKLEAVKPDNDLIAAHIAIIYNRIKNYKEAIIYFHKAILLSPENLDYRYNLAIIYDHVGLFQEAIYLYNQILRKNFTNKEYNFDYDKIIKRINYLSNR